MSLTQTEFDYLAGQRLERLATLRPGETLQNTPVGCHYNPSTGIIDNHRLQPGRQQEVRNVLDNGQVAFVVDDFVSTDPGGFAASRYAEPARP